MATYLNCLVVDALDPALLGAFWATCLEWTSTTDADGDVRIVGTADDIPIDFLRTDEPKRGKNRMHLDIASSSDDERVAIVQRCLDLGASHRDVGQGDVPWTVLADPEGNEFCVIGPQVADTGSIRAICLDAGDVATMRDFWIAASGWEVVAREAKGANGEARFVALRRADGRGPVLVMGPEVAPKTGKNRIHLDVAPPPGGDHLAEAERLVSLGATRVDIGQGDASWVVLADPEGNEFCVLTPRDPESIASTPDPEE